MDFVHVGDRDGRKGIYLVKFLNYHRPCLFPVEYRDPAGKIRRRYPRQGVTTPYEAFKSLDDAHIHLKPGLTFAQLDAVAYAESDLAAAKRRTGR